MAEYIICIDFNALGDRSVKEIPIEKENKKLQITMIMIVGLNEIFGNYVQYVCTFYVTKRPRLILYHVPLYQNGYLRCLLKEKKKKEKGFVLITQNKDKSLDTRSAKE